MGPLITTNTPTNTTHPNMSSSCISPPITTYSNTPCNTLPLNIPHHQHHHHNMPPNSRHVDSFITDLLHAVSASDSSVSGAGTNNDHRHTSSHSHSHSRGLSVLAAGTVALCSSCEEGIAASSRCRDCSEMLCELCVRAHLRVRVTKDHRIVRFGGGSAVGSLGSSSQASNSPTTCHHSSTSSSSNSSSTITCTNTPDHTLDPIQPPIGHHRPSAYTNNTHSKDDIAFTMRLSAECRLTNGAIRYAIESVQRMLETLEVRSHQTCQDVRNMVKRYISTLEERERDLLNHIEQHKHVRSKSLHVQMENLRLMLSKLTRTSDMLNDSLETGSGLDLVMANEKASVELGHLRGIRAELRAIGDATAIDDSLMLLPPDGALLRAVGAMGTLTSSDQQQRTTGNGAHLLRARNKETIYPTSPMAPVELKPDSVEILTFNNQLQHQNAMGGLRPPRGRPIHGLAAPIVVREVVGAGSASVGSGSMLSVGAFSFGSEGEMDGQLCRPWGVCCDRLGNIIVADRSNNRVQIFHPNGLFSHKFGIQGTAPGQFDRPAGVAIDPQNRIVVADKDNHRIQLFTIDGNFLFMFGEKGSRNGQFNYPWDVAVNSHGHIIVSDTRNHRVQLFTHEGMFLNKYGFESSANMWKHFDSPRGVAFNPNGSILITDFNNHRLVVIDQNLQHAQFLGQEGSGFKQFLRPQGIVCDDEGRIIVADSRNNRIQVFESNGTFLWKIGQAGTGPGELDRPSGICINPDGRIVVVDFGNNRMQIF